MLKYARREPTNDKVMQYPDFKKFFEDKKDVVAYDDENCKREYARFPWYYNSKPDKRNKYVNINCHKWVIVWLKDL